MAFVKVPNSHGGKRGHGHISTKLKQIPSWGEGGGVRQISGKTAGEMWFMLHHLEEAKSLWQPAQKNCLVVTLFISAKPFFFFPINYSSSLCQNRCGITETNPNLSCSDLKARTSSLLVILKITGGNLRSAADWKTAQSSFNPDRECRRITLSILKHRHITSLSLT